MTTEERAYVPGVTAQFERFVLVLAVTFAAYRLLFSLFAPDAWHIPDIGLLAVMLGLVGYLWMTQAQALARLRKSEAALRDAHLGVLAALVQAVEAKDPYTRGHSEQVRRVSVDLARKLDLREERVGIVSRAAILHDVGKIETPDTILHKREKLTDEEWRILRNHPERTATILSPLGFLSEEIRLAVLHHERYDGGGYGAGPKHSDIPLEASIIAVADTFDAMNSDRPYRLKLPREKILEELRTSRGTQHAPAVVDGLLELLGEHPELWIRLPAPADGVTSASPGTDRPTAGGEPKERGPQTPDHRPQTNAGAPRVPMDAVA